MQWLRTIGAYQIGSRTMPHKEVGHATSGDEDCRDSKDWVATRQSKQSLKDTNDFVQQEKKSNR